VATAAANRGVFLLVGTARASGYRLGLDSEMDFALDGDEAAAGAVVGVVDTDNDGFPDGYEMRLGSNPASAASLPPPDVTPPSFTSGPTVSWKSANIAKVRWQTGEEGTSLIEVRPAGASPTSTPILVKQDLQFKKEHVLVVRGLPPGQSFDLYVKSTDPASPGNTGTSVLTNVAIQSLDFQSAHIAQTTLTTGTITCGSTVTLKATFKVVDQNGNPVPGATVNFTEVEWTTGTGNTVAAFTTGPADPLGNASRVFTSSRPACGVKVEVFATSVSDPTTNLLYFHPLDGQFGFWQQTSF
jgi:thrombospondin type 3 repeat protein